MPSSMSTGEVEVLEDAVEERERALHVDRDVSRLPIGANSRVCSVVKATSVPIVEYDDARGVRTSKPPNQ